MSFQYRVEQSFRKQYQADDVVKVIKNTRGKHSLPKAIKGNEYLVISQYTNSFGTTKYIVLDIEGVEHFTTGNSIEKVETLGGSSPARWAQAKRIWMDRTYVPVFGVHTYDYIGMPFVSSRDGNSRLIKPLFNNSIKTDDGIWIHKSRVHDDDVKLFMSSSFPPDAKKKGERSETVTFRVPAWFAEKKGLFDGNKSK